MKIDNNSNSENVFMTEKIDKRSAYKELNSHRWAIWTSEMQSIINVWSWRKTNKHTKKLIFRFFQLNDQIQTECVQNRKKNSNKNSLFWTEMRVSKKFKHASIFCWFYFVKFFSKHLQQAPFCYLLILRSHLLLLENFFSVCTCSIAFIHNM